MKKKLIRNGVFETNSSSCHSLSIVKDSNLLDTIYPDKDGNIVLTGGEFGWGYEKYTDALNKANYVAVMILHLESDKRYFTETEDKSRFEYYSLPEFAFNNYEACKNNFELALKEHTGCENIIYDCSLEYDSPNWSYIDHQSLESASDTAWLLSIEDIRMFIFNPASTLIIDNDNH